LGLRRIRLLRHKFEVLWVVPYFFHRGKDFFFGGNIYHAHRRNINIYLHMAVTAGLVAVVDFEPADTGICISLLLTSSQQIQEYAFSICSRSSRAAPKKGLSCRFSSACACVCEVPEPSAIVLVTDGSAFEIDGAAGVLPVFKDIANGCLFPPARVFGDFLRMFPADGLKIGDGREYLFFLKLSCNLHRTFP